MMGSLFFFFSYPNRSASFFATQPIRQQLHYELPLAVLFFHPTVADLAVVLRKDVRNEEMKALVPIKPEGSAPPCYCVHPAGGTLFHYYPLAQSLGPDQPFYGLQTPDLDGKGGSFQSIEEAAHHYIAAIQAMQPCGPYFLGGWSLGGILAFEMAQQLQRRGHEVALLAILDAEAPAPSVLSSDQRLEAGDRGLIKLAMIYYNVAAPDEDFYQLDLAEQLQFVLKQAKANNLVPVDTEPELFYRQIRTRTANIQLLGTYTPQIYPGRIILFRSSESIEAREAKEQQKEPSARRDITLSWAGLTPVGVEVHKVPGTHVSMLEEPNVQVLAEMLKTYLDEPL